MLVGKNRGGEGTKKQCSLCTAAGRNGTGHRAPSCPWRHVEDVEMDTWEDGGKARFADAAKEAESRARAQAAKLRKASLEKAVVTKTQEATELMRAERKKLEAARAAAKAAEQAAKKAKKAKAAATPPSTPPKPPTVSPHELLLSKSNQREQVRLAQEEKALLSRKRKLSIVVEESEEEANEGANSMVCVAPEPWHA